MILFKHDLSEEDLEESLEGNFKDDEEICLILKEI